MAFNWNFKPRTLNGFNSAPVESFMPQAPGAIPTQMKGQGFSPDYNIQGLPQDTEDYQRAAYMDAYEADEAQKAQALQAQQMGQQKRIADIQNQIATLEKRIAENTAKLQTHLCIAHSALGSGHLLFCRVLEKLDARAE